MKRNKWNATNEMQSAVDEGHCLMADEQLGA